MVSYWDGLFSGAMLVSGRIYQNFTSKVFLSKNLKLPVFVNHLFKGETLANKCRCLEPCRPETGRENNNLCGNQLGEAPDFEAGEESAGVLILNNPEGRL